MNLPSIDVADLDFTFPIDWVSVSERNIHIGHFSMSTASEDLYVNRHFMAYSLLCGLVGLPLISFKALAHYKDFRNNFSKHIFVKIVAHIETC